jgi:hypothetical protein
MAPAPSSAFRERLAYYLLGVAISCVLLGFLWAARYQAAQRRAAQSAAPAAAPAPTGAPATPGSSVK